jgi:phenol/toluene 2-monooxygenase (NADH) P4/A4
MAVKALYDYDFPSADRAENFGDDQLVYVHWEGNLFLVAAATFRAPKAMPFSEFVAAMVNPWASSDPDFDPSSVSDWRVDDRPLAGPDGASLADLGIGHKSLVKFRTS